ncbi:MAG: hypothetical protein B9S32_14210 [Verrucomicrobia bacterium Tous-C9LFEB]|nr:MAG: hypothetical protein B9S32_14210 [Verrucomicrobia bacterium Tous-C9LFEB]
MVTIATFVNLGEAELTKTHLEGSGITAFIPDEFVARNDWFWITALGGVRLQVSDIDVERALEILASRRATSEGILEIITCPECSSTEVKQDDFLQRLALVILCIFKIPIPFSKRTYVCQKCGHRWK